MGCVLAVDRSHHISIRVGKHRADHLAAALPGRAAALLRRPGVDAERRRTVLVAAGSSWPGAGYAVLARLPGRDYGRCR
jgi:hypothetical protein